MQQASSVLRQWKDDFFSRIQVLLMEHRLRGMAARFSNGHFKFSFKLMSLVLH